MNTSRQNKKIVKLHHRGWFWEARSQILLWYVGLMLGLIGLSIPLFSHLVLHQVDTRVREDLEEEIEKFETFFEQNINRYSDSSEKKSLKILFKNFLSQAIPEDDTFLITIIDNQFYHSSPRGLPKIIQPDSELMKEWKTLSQKKSNKEKKIEASIDSVLYIAKPINLGEKEKGIFIAAHLTTGEKKEAFDVIVIVSRVLLIGLIIAIILAWIATGKLLTPLKSLAKTVSNIGELALEQRISVEGKGEIAELGIAFNEMMNRLQSTFDSQRNFLNDVGHELRTPITIIQGHLELMGDDPQEQQATIALVLDELDRMNRLVNDLTLLAKSERPDFLQQEIIDIATFTEEIYCKATRLANREWVLENKAQGQILGDRQRLTQALINLAKNASQHTTKTDQIRIGSTQINQTIYLWVQDTGEGIETQAQERIFERFVRGNIRNFSEGSGLGLSIVKAIIEAHDGGIELVSKVGKGSTFTIILPLTDKLNRKL